MGLGPSGATDTYFTTHSSTASEVEQNIVSVERILQYIELPPESPYEIPEAKPDGVWPSEGALEFRYVYPTLQTY